MDALREFIRQYRRMTEYRDGEYRPHYNRDCLKKFVAISFLFAFVLGLDLLSYILSGNSGEGTSLEALKIIVRCLAGTGTISLVALHRKLSSGLQELGRALSVLVMLAFYLYAMHFELTHSGGLYIYLLAILIFAGIIHLRLREYLLVVMVVDFAVVYTKLADDITIAGAQIYLSPVRMMIFCSVLAVVLAWWRNYEYLSLVYQRSKLRRISGSDALTGLLNRRGMEDKLRRHGKGKGPVCAAILDIDDFKKYNDTYGHVAGDECLRLVARLLKETAMRHHALAVRYGGEEMVLLFFTANRDRVREILRDALKELRELRRPSGRQATHEFLTLSCGLFVSKKDMGHNIDEYYSLIAEADKNLYIAKRCGKDCVVG